CVINTASSRFKPNRKACWRKSEEVSTKTDWPACSMRIETRKRLSRGSFDVQVSQSQAIEGTPVDVPVPRNVSFMMKSKVQHPRSNVRHWTLDIEHWTGVTRP